MRWSAGTSVHRLREFNGEDDHVHLLVEYPTEAAVAALVNSLKACLGPGGSARTSPGA